VNYLYGEKISKLLGRKQRKRSSQLPLTKNIVLIPTDGFAHAHNSSLIVFLFANTLSKLFILFTQFSSWKSNESVPRHFGPIHL
jgi:hypothetical protein